MRAELAELKEQMAGGGKTDIDPGSRRNLLFSSDFLAFLGFTLIFLLLTITGLFGSMEQARAEEIAKGESGEDTLILIHLDGINAEIMWEQMEEGNLPNLKSFFYKDEMRNQALTYFPPSSPVVINRLRRGKEADEGEVVDWDGYSREEKRPYHKVEIDLETITSISRRARENYLHSRPAVKYFADWSLVNLAGLVEDYSVLEFYWFSTDYYGHRFGREAQLHELERFDRSFGRLVDRLPKGINIIVYSDHGMTFGEGVDGRGAVEEALEDKLKVFSYPNIYLRPGSDLLENGIIKSEKQEMVEELCEEIVRYTPLDFAFYRPEPDSVIGVSSDSRFEFKEAEEGISYTYEGRDEFGYYEAGYEGEYLNEREWLELTMDRDYPAVPPAVYSYVSNPDSGEIVTVINPPEIITEGHVEEGAHLSFAAQDMVVPLLARGKLVDTLYEEDKFWLPALFSEWVDVNFEEGAPDRESHEIKLWAGLDGLAGHFSFSPAYRTRLGLETDFRKNAGKEKDDGGNGAGDSEENREDENWEASRRLQGQGLFDVYSSYLHRLWLGAEYERNLGAGEGSLRPLLRYELRFRRLTASIISSLGAENLSLRLSYELTSSLEIKVIDFNSLGISLSW